MVSTCPDTWGHDKQRHTSKIRAIQMPIIKLHKMGGGKPDMSYLAQSIKRQWVEFRGRQDMTGHSYLNMGRVSLSRYIEITYEEYVKLCRLTGSEALSLGKFLTQKTLSSFTRIK